MQADSSLNLWLVERNCSFHIHHPRTTPDYTGHSYGQNGLCISKAKRIILHEIYDTSLTACSKKTNAYFLSLDSSRSLPPALSRLNQVIEGQQTGFGFFAWKRLRIASQVWKITVDHGKKRRKYKRLLHNSDGENYSRIKVSEHLFLGLVLVLTSFHQTWLNSIKRVLISSFSVIITSYFQIVYRWLKVFKKSTKLYNVQFCIEAMYVDPWSPDFHTESFLSVTILYFAIQKSILLYTVWCCYFTDKINIP